MRSFNFDLLSLLFFKSFSGGTGAADPNLLYDNLFTSLWSDPAKKFGSEEVRLQLRQNDKDPCSVVDKE